MDHLLNCDFDLSIFLGITLVVLGLYGITRKG